MQSRQKLSQELIEHLESILSHRRSGSIPAWSGLDLTMPQARTLFYLVDGPLRVSGIAGRLAVEMPSATAMIDRLVFKGLVERSQDSADRRAVVCSLTPAGRDAVETFWSLRASKTERLVSVLSTQELEVVVPAMRIMAEAVTRSGVVGRRGDGPPLKRAGRNEEPGS